MIMFLMPSSLGHVIYIVLSARKPWMGLLKEMYSPESEVVRSVHFSAGWVCIQNRDCPLSRGLVAGPVQIRARFRPLATTPSVAVSSLDSARTLLFPLLFFLLFIVSPDES